MHHLHEKKIPAKSDNQSKLVRCAKMLPAILTRVSVDTLVRSPPVELHHTWGAPIPPVVLPLHGTVVGRDYLPEASPGTEPWPRARQRWHATATPLNNYGRTDYLRLSHLTALPAGVNNHLRCIHKGLAAFSRVTPPIEMHDQTILTRSFDPMCPHLTQAKVGSRSY